MNTKWLSSNFDHDKIILAGDIGGTNTNLAIVGEKNSQFTIIMTCVYPSQDVNDLMVPIEEVIKITTEKNTKLKPELCCISAAGPVADNCCKMTNCDFDVDGNEIKSKTGIDTIIINDFLAIGYGIPTLDVNDNEQITILPNTDGTTPEQTGTTKAVVGAGTGLGVGFLTAINGKYTAYPSEGGHSGFAPFDDETKELTEYLTEKYNMAPGTEPFVSGQGIANIFNFLKEKKGLTIEGVLAEIDKVDNEDKPALISKNADSNETCKKIMQLFVKMYGKFSGSAAVLFFATGGLYLAGGIASKNEKYFLEDNLFMKYFEMNYNPNIRPLLKKIPVYIIRDYDISLYGAANAAVSLLR